MCRIWTKVSKDKEGAKTKDRREGRRLECDDDKGGKRKDKATREKEERGKRGRRSARCAADTLPAGL